jgi:trk system potassium uptake protein TrkA
LDPKHVVVVGCGRVGAELSTRLLSAGHSVALIDKSPASFRRLPGALALKRIVGFGFDQDTLRAAGIENAHAVAAVTSGDNSNILTARIAREYFEVPNVVARIYDPRRAVVYQRLGIQTVATVTWTTQQAMERLFPLEFSSEWSDSSGTLAVTEIGLPPSRAGRPLAEIDLPDRVKVIGLVRGNESRILSPGIIAQEGDRIIVLVKQSFLMELSKHVSGVPE